LSQDHFLDPADLSSLELYAKTRGFISAEESLVSANKAGEGNMNLTLRLVTDQRSFILKQARPWVEKYPQIPAPDSRALVETAFYQAAAKRTTLREAMPQLLASDPDARVLVLEDLGDAGDFTSLYSSERLSETDLDALVSYLVALHVRWKDLAKIFANREMRELNHEHIFRLPLASDNGIDLEAFTGGLQAASEPLKKDSAYVERVTELGELYLTDGDTLVHGDYFPGSWLRVADGVRIIDPEFCFIGPAVFDVGVMIGHLYLAHQPDELIDRALSRYGADASTRALARQFAGVEIMRRLIGVAQLPLDYDIEKKRELLELSHQLVLAA
jgi:5-methylthioribose kinase